MLGQSEHLAVLKNDFKTVDRKWRLYQCQTSRPYVSGLQWKLNYDKLKTERFRENRALSLKNSDIKDQLLQSLLGRFAPRGLLVNQDYEIVFMNGDLNSFLEFREGPFDPRLFKLLKSPINDLIRDGLEKIGPDKHDIRYENVRINKMTVTITLQALTIDDYPQQCFYIIHFNDSGDDTDPLIIREVDHSEITRRRIAGLESELAATKEQLQNTIEELQSSNEELLSSNEELQSTNEELQTVNKNLLESEEKYRRIVQDQKEFIVKMSNEFRIDFANSSYCQYIYKSLEEITGTSFLNFLCGENREFFERTATSLSVSTSVDEIEICQKPNEGSLQWERWIIRKLISENGNPMGYQLTGWNQTEQKIVEEALKSSEKRYKELFNSMQNGFALHQIITDDQGLPINYRFISINSAFEKITGLTREKIIGKTVLEVLPETEDFWIKTYGDVALSGEAVDFENYSASLGKHFHIYAFSPQPGQFAVIFSDVTESVLNQMELIQAREAAEKADQLKTLFLSNMSHEIRTPMNAILGFSELLELDDISREEQKSYSHLIRINGDLLINLINDIIDMSKIESNQIQLNNSLYSVKNLLDETYSSLKMTVPEQVELRREYRLSDSEDIVILDKNRVKQVLTNLINNSRKYTLKGSIEFGCSLREEKSELLFYVKDTGIGIPKEQFDLIFERFHQVDEMSPGAGLGLNICKGLVQIMGGELWLESVPDSGTTFYFTLPWIKTHKPPRKQEDKDSPTEICESIILVAEDNYTNFLLIQSLMKEENVRIIHARDGEEAVHLMRQYPEISLILMDLKLPNMDGMAATRQIREDFPSLPIIALTAYASNDYRIQALNAGCNDYITKPFPRESLLRVLHKYLPESKDS